MRLVRLAMLIGAEICYADRTSEVSYAETWCYTEILSAIFSATYRYIVLHLVLLHRDAMLYIVLHTVTQCYM